MVESMFHMELPEPPNLFEPVIVYLCVVAFLRLFGKRELAHLNPFEPIVRPCLSNSAELDHRKL